MLNLYQLQHLVAFAQAGTISQAAQDLLLSQPALTRSLQRLEEDLGVKLFERQKNRTSLNELGHYTVAKAQVLLNQAQDFLNQVHHESRKTTTIFCGIEAPGIRLEIENRLVNRAISQKLELIQADSATLLEKLLAEDFQVIVTAEPIKDTQLVSQVFFKEQLYLNVLPSHPYADKEGISLSDLDKLTILLLTDLGAWESLISLMPKTHFIRQASDDTFTSLIEASALPYFSTNITQDYLGADPHRVQIPLIDPEATLTFYLHTLKKNQSLLSLIN